MPIGWDNPATADYYERFCRRHGRYREANAELVEHAALEGDPHVLDLAAGTGRTTEAALPLLGPGASVVCFEPAAAMRAAGERRLDDGRVAWTGERPSGEVFDRILCGAAVWQLGPLEEVLGGLARLVAPDGAMAFTVPALYLGEPDEPGGGSDPLLLELPRLLANGRAPDAPPGKPLPTASRVEELLDEAGLCPFGWQWRRRATQAELRDWLKIPVLTDRILSDLGPDERARMINAAYERVDARSWRWELWRGWTAWRRPA